MGVSLNMEEGEGKGARDRSRVGLGSIIPIHKDVWMQVIIAFPRRWVRSDYQPSSRLGLPRPPYRFDGMGWYLARPNPGGVARHDKMNRCLGVQVILCSNVVYFLGLLPILSSAGVP